MCLDSKGWSNCYTKAPVTLLCRSYPLQVTYFDEQLLYLPNYILHPELLISVKFITTVKNFAMMFNYVYKLFPLPKNFLPVHPSPQHLSVHHHLSIVSLLYCPWSNSPFSDKFHRKFLYWTCNDLSQILSFFTLNNSSGLFSYLQTWSYSSHVIWLLVPSSNGLFLFLSL